MNPFRGEGVVERKILSLGLCGTFSSVRHQSFNISRLHGFDWFIITIYSTFGFKHMKLVGIELNR